MHALASVCVSRTRNEMKRKKNGYSVVKALLLLLLFVYGTAVFVMTTTTE